MRIKDAIDSLLYLNKQLLDEFAVLLSNNQLDIQSILDRIQVSFNETNNQYAIQINNKPPTLKGVDPLVVNRYYECTIPLQTLLRVYREIPSLEWDVTFRGVWPYMNLAMGYLNDKTNQNKTFSVLLHALVKKWISLIDVEIAQDMKIESEFGQYLKPISIEEVKQYTFDSIIGLAEAKNALLEGFIYPFKFPLLYPTRATGVLLYGAPGTGKTLLARASVNQLGQLAYLFAPPPESFRGEYEGQTETKIVAIFNTMNSWLDRHQPTRQYAILAIDEAESLLGEGRGQGEASKQRSVNTFLQCMEGLKTNQRIIVMLITNYPDQIDKGILRRLSLRIHVEFPNLEETKQIIEKALIEHYIRPLSRYITLTNERVQLYQYFRQWGTDEAGVLRDSNTTPQALADTAQLMITKDKEIGYSPSDIAKVVQLACHHCSREVIDQLTLGRARFLYPVRLVKPSTGSYYIMDLITYRLSAASTTPGSITTSTIARIPNGTFSAPREQTSYFYREPKPEEDDNTVNQNVLYIYTPDETIGLTESQLRPRATAAEHIVSFRFKWKYIETEMKRFRKASDWEDYERILRWEKGKKEDNEIKINS